jgi:N-acetylglucosaminyldiphosphoundecaprenol N-acetyl-beta-D-mannosaminyltransferase
MFGESVASNNPAGTHPPAARPSTSEVPGPTFPACGVRMAAVSPGRAAELVVAAGRDGESLQVHLCNAYTLSLLDRDAELRRAVETADVNLPDGTPVAWLGRRHGSRGPVRGPDLVRDVMRLGAGVGLRHYLYGGAPGVAALMRQRLEGSIPGLQIVGVESPPYGAIGSTALAELAERAKTAGAQVVWVGLGTPKQDYLVPRLAELVDCPVVPVGAAFDYLAGTVKEAPTFIRGTGFEWVHRLATEPRRLWRRYLVGNARFVASAAGHAWKGRHDRADRAEAAAGSSRRASAR